MKLHIWKAWCDMEEFETAEELEMVIEDDEKIIDGVEESTCDYNDFMNKPQINGVELKGNKTSEQLRIANADDVVKLNTKVAVLEEDNAKQKSEISELQVENEQLKKQIPSRTSKWKCNTS